MNRMIRRAAYTILILFGVVFVNLNLIQLINADDVAAHNSNHRILLREYAIERGSILDSQGQTVAQSAPTPDEDLKFLRTYSYGSMFSHVSGFYSFIFGRSGVEKSHNRELTGEAGVLTMQDLTDRLLEGGRKGDTVYLTIDANVQKAAAEALAGKRGAVVALDPVSGQVIAMASFPSFDPNPLSSHDAKQIRSTWDANNSDPLKPLINRATQESYPPGSTFKVVTAAAALEHGIGVETTFPSATEFQPPQTTKTINNFGGGRCGGDMNDGLRVSCNTYFAQIGVALTGPDFQETAEKFGFGQTPPIDIEAAPSQIPSTVDLASPAFRAQAAIGQFDVRATPLQMALVAAAVASEGNVPEPTLLKEVRDVDQAIVRSAEPETWNRAMTPQSAAILKQMMIEVVEQGTGRNAQIEGVEVGGKTGTAQAGQEGAAPHAWFIAFAGTDSPRIAVAAVVENGGDLGSEATGGRLAAPIVKAVIEAHRKAAGW